MQLDFVKTSGGIYHMGPVPDKGGTDLALLPRVAPKTKKPPLYNVVMVNDDYTPVRFVVDLLKAHFNKNAAESERLAEQIHTQGRAIAGTYPWEVAETKAILVIDLAKAADHPFRAAPEIA